MFTYNINRQLTAQPICGDGLCLAGVGIDVNEFRFFKNMPKIMREKVTREMECEAIENQQ